METETGETKIALSSTVPVSVTDNGFDPAVVTVTVGTTVEWTNRTQETVHLQSGEPYRIYLPLVLRNVGGAGGQMASAPESAAQAEVRLTASTTFSGTLPPGGTLTHTFTSEGNYLYFLTNNPAWTGLVNVEPIPFDFEMGATPPSHSVAQGQGVTYTVRITGTLGDPQPVTLTVGGLPTVAAWGLNPSTVVPTSTAVLSITTPLTTPVGNHTLVITGTGGGQVHTATATLVVTPHPDFEVAVAPAVRSIMQGQSVTYTVSLTGLHGFDKPISLSADGLPAGTAAIWDQNPLTPTDTTVLTITTSLTTPPGSHSLTVTGSGGGLTHTAEMTLTVVAALPDLVVESIQTTPAIPIAGQDTLITVTIHNQGETATNPFQANWYVNPASPPGVGDCGVVSWTVNGLGPGASAALTTTHIFTPAGNYGLWGQADTLDTVAEGNEVNNVTGPVTATVFSAVQEVCGTISEDTIWYSGVVYVVTCDVTVQSEMALTVQAGVVVKFDTGRKMNVNGTLIAEGTEAAPVVFTSLKDDTYGGDTNGDGSVTTPAGGDWRYIRVNGAATLDYAIVQYGGSGSYGMLYLYGGSLTMRNSIIAYSGYHGLHAYNPTSLTLTDNTFLNNTNYAVYLSFSNSGVTPILSGNTASGNGINGIGLGGSMNTTTLPVSAGFPYVIDDLTVNTGATLIVQAGTVVKFSGYNADLYVNGDLSVQGTVTNPVVFTSLKDDAYGGDTNGDGSSTIPAGGDWYAIRVHGAATLDYAIIQYGGSGGYGMLYLNGGSLTVRNSTIAYSGYHGLHAYNPTSLTLTDNTFLNNTNYAVYLSFSNSGVTPILSGNTASGNGINGIGLGGSMNTTTLPVSAGFPYVIDDLTVNTGATLIVQAGTVVKFSGYNADLYVNGDLSVQGTVTNPVVFTSLKDDAYGGDTNGDGSSTIPAGGDWYAIRVHGAATLDYAIVQYGGSGGYGMLYLNGGSLTVRNSTIAYSGYHGLHAYNPTSLTLTDNTFLDNTNYAAYLSFSNSGVTSILSGNTASGNGINGIGLGGSMNTTTLPVSAGFPYVIDDLTVNTGATLIVQAGTVVKFSGYNADLYVNGDLSVQGTVTNPVVFTSLKDDAYGGDTNGDGSSTIPAGGDWYAIRVHGAATLDYAIVQYGGSGGYGMLYLNGGSLTVRNSTIAYSGYHGLHAYNPTSLTLTDNTFLDNTNYAAYLSFSNSGVTSILSGNTASGNGINGIGLGGSMNTTTLPVSAGFPYVIDDLTVNTGATLIVQAGTVVKFSGYNADLYVNGDLSVQGTVTNPVVFTSLKDDAYGGDTNGDGNATTPAGGDWYAIRVHGAATLDYAIVQYGGSGGYGMLYLNGGSLTVRNSTIAYSGYHGLHAYNPTSLTLTDNTFLDNTNYAAYLSFSNSGVTSILSGNTASGNGINGIGLGGSMNTTTLPVSAGFPYVIDDLTVNTGATLIVQAGTVVKFSGYNADLYVNGDLSVQGTVTNPVVFTSLKDDAYGGDTNGDGNATTPAGGDWYAIRVHGAATLDYAIVQYGGSGGYGMLYLNGGSLTVRNSTIAYSGYHGLHAYNPTSLTLTDNTFLDNTNYAAYLSFSNSGVTSILSGNTASGNGINGIGLGGSMDTTTLPVSAGFPYVVDGLTVNTGATFIVQAGTVVKFSGYDKSLYVYGDLSVQGTVTNPVVFTSLKDDAYGGDTNGDGSATTPTGGDWRYIWVNGAATLDYAIIQYGGSGGYGVYNNDGTLSITNSTIAYNASYGVYHYRGSSTIHYSNIYGHSAYGIYNADTSSTISAENNWWGHESGPYHPTLNPSGQGDRVSDGVDFDPWVGQSTYTASRSAPSSPATGFETDPVNVVFGNYVHQRIDLSVSDRGAAFVFERAYNSVHATVTSPLSYGWRHSYDITVVTETAGAASFAIVTWPDGRQDRYTKNDGFYTPPAGIYHTLVQNPDGTFTLTRKDQTRYNFTAQGSLASIVDSNGNTMIFGYTGDNLSTITLSNGCVVTLTYSGSRLTGLSGPAGRTVGFGYTGSHLTVVTDTRGFTTTYAYDAQGRLESITDANKHTFVHNTYSADGRVVEQRDALNNLTTLAYYTATRQTVVVDPLGHVITHTYDSAYRITGEQDALGYQVAYQWDADNNRTTVTDKRDNTTHFAYDGQGNVTQIVDTLDYTRTFIYDAFNNPTGETNPLGHTTVYTYDASSNLIARADPQGNVTTWAYDTYGQVISQTDGLTRTTHYAYDAYGHQTTITDALTNTTTFTYDLVGRKLSETDPESHTTNYAYDAVNHITVITDALSNPTFYTYDAVGNRTIITDANGHPTTFTYDEKDRLVSVTDPLSHTTTYGYDEVSNQTVVTDALGYATTYAYDALNRRTAITDTLGNTTHYQYDANGNRTHLTDANGNATQYAYDALNRLVSVTDAESGTVTYTYDANGNRTSMTDANDHATAYTHDSLNRLISVTDPLTYTTIYTYDAVGNRVGEQKPDGTVITYTYDILDHLVDVSAPGLSVEYAYDTVGGRTMMTDATGVTTYTYDALYRLTQVAATTGTLQYTYDLNGNRTHLTYPDGEVVTYTYDLANRPTTVTDWAGRVITYTYDDAGRQTEVAYPNNVQASYTYDDAGRLLVITHTNSVSGTFAFSRYSLDAVGNRLVMTDTDGVTAYAYDDLYRLVQVNYPDSEQVAYAYDPMGNRTALTSTVSGVVTYTYDAGDRLLTTGSDTFGWDANGRMITRTYGINTASYTFDALDRLTQVISGATTVQFTYNGDGVRVGKSVGGASTQYMQDVGAPLPVVLAETTGGQTSLYIYGNDLETWVDPAGNPTFYHYDGLGSTRALSNLAGQRTDAYSYDVFGAVRSHTGGAAQPFTFTGEQVDDELGLVYLRARYYDPQVGRFLTRDGFPGVDFLTQSRNRYVYVSNNPVLQDDPDGQIWNFVAGAGAGVLEYTVKVAVSNVLEGKPLSNIFEGWDAGEAAFSGARGAVVYGLGLGPAASALVSGASDAGTSVYRQWKNTGQVDVLQATAEGVVGGVTSFALNKMLPYPGAGVRGRLPTGKYWQTALFGAHARREYLKAIWSGSVRAPAEERIKAYFWPKPAYAYELNQVYSLSPSAQAGQLQIGSAGGGSWGGPPSGGK